MLVFYRLYQALWLSLDWLFPPHCAGCGKAGFRFCPECQENATQVRPPLCPTCGEMQRTESICSRCAKGNIHYQAARAWGLHYGPLQKVVHNLKYKRDIALGERMARPMTDMLRQTAWPIDLIIPVPLGRKRLQERGYNQAALLARPIALALALPYRPNALQRTRETRTQVGLNRMERWENVSGAFHADPKLARGKVILLVDDVTTSGATLNAAAQALALAGAEKVFALTLARAMGSSSIHSPKP